jgi:hypothetical protein
VKSTLVLIGAGIAIVGYAVVYNGLAALSASSVAFAHVGIVDLLIPGKATPGQGGSQAAGAASAEAGATGGSSSSSSRNRTRPTTGTGGSAAPIQPPAGGTVVF